MNWLKVLFTRRRRGMDRIPMFTRLVNAFCEQRAMRGYLREMGDCTTPQMIPSRDLRKRYGLYDSQDTLEVWAILEKYIKGELVDKQAVIDQVNRDLRQNAHASR